MTENNEYICREGGEADFQNLADFLVRHDYAPKHLSWAREDYLDWLRWKFLDNPDGPGRLWIMEDLTGTIVGVRANLPRRFANRKTGTFLCYHGVDALIETKLRGKRLYSNLQNFSTARLDLPSISFPRALIFNAAVRRGDYVIGPTEKWWFPVALGQSIPEKNRRFVLPMIAVSSRLYAFFWLGKPPTDLTMEPVARFERDFEIDTPFIHGVRSADYLNWRFVDNRMYDYSAYEFFQNGESIGYCVYRDAGSKTEIFDFVVSRRHRGCLRLLVEHCRNREIIHMRFRGIGLRLGKFGFVPRRDKLNHCKATKDVPRAPWMLTLADRDY